MPATASRPEQEPADQGTADALPVDVDTIRATVDRALTHGPVPRYQDLQDLEQLLRGHMQLLLPLAETAVDTLWHGSVDWYTERATLDIARSQLNEGLGSGLVSAHGHVRQLAYSCRTLLRYAEAGGK